MYHVPVLLEQSVDGLNVGTGRLFVDVTYGGGGHSAEILRRLPPDGRLYAFDRDEDALRNASSDPRFTMIHGNFRFLKNYLRYNGVTRVDGILADLGVSSHHFDDPQRGFTFQGEAPLDMRMNQKAPRTSEYIVNEYSSEELSDIFYNYGEIDNARRLASTITAGRTAARIRTNRQLVDLIMGCAPRHAENKYLAKVFQALRIEVNGEMTCLRELLRQSVEVLRPGGRLSIITYHSLEDRMVKNFFRNGSFDAKAEKDIYGNVHLPLRQLQSKVITPTEGEIAVNSRARSAKLRIAERTEENL